MDLRLWFEFQSHLPGSRSLLRMGAAQAGGGFRGFSIDPPDPISDPIRARELISGPEDEYAEAAHARLAITPLAYRGLDVSGWLLLRQAKARMGQPMMAGDRADHIDHIPDCLDDVIQDLPITIAYNNHEAGGGVDWQYETLCDIWPLNIPLMSTGMTYGKFEMYNRWGLMPRTIGYRNFNYPFLAFADGWLCSPEWNMARYRGTQCGPLWNSMIDSINQIISIRAAGLTPCPNVPGITRIDTAHSVTRPTTPYERSIYRDLMRAYALLGVKDVIVFNSGGRGAHLKDPIVDFAAMIDEDTQTTMAGTNLPKALPFYRRPTEPIPFDSPSFKIGSVTFTHTP